MLRKYNMKYEKSDNGSIALQSSIQGSVYSESRDLQEEDKEQQEDGEISRHMVARWYRPPEIILGNYVYDSKIDIWSLGCIFAELIYTW